MTAGGGQVPLTEHMGGMAGLAPPWIRRCSILYRFRYWASHNGVTLKSGLEVTQGRWKNGTIRKLGYCFLFTFHNNYGSTVFRFNIGQKKVTIFSYPPAFDFDAPVSGSPSEYCHSHKCWQSSYLFWRHIVKMSCTVHHLDSPHGLLSDRTYHAHWLIFSSFFD